MNIESKKLILSISLLMCATALPNIYAAPLGTPDVEDIEYPDDEENSKAEIALGKTLFFDNRLSINDKQSCATCHNPNLGFGDGMAVSLGTMGELLGRNSPHLYNLAVTLREHSLT